MSLKNLCRKWLSSLDPKWINVNQALCEEPIETRYGGINGGPLVSSEMTDVERRIREQIDHFDAIYLPGPDNWLMRQRTGRLCENIIDVVLLEMEKK